MNRKNIPNLAIRFKQKDIRIDFSGGQISSDAGLVLLKQFDRKSGFMQNINKLIEDPRIEKKITHTQQELLTQRIYQIIAGYEDCNDASLLRDDPIMKLIADKQNINEPLGSQPTLSRFENRIPRKQITMLKRQLMEQFINNISHKDDESIILDCDSTEDPTHGQQQLSFFSKLFDSKCYHPFLVFESKTKSLLTAHLRPGNYNPSRNGRRILLPVIRKLKHKFPKKQIIIRGDCSFGSYIMHEFCLKEGVYYILAVGNTSYRFDPYIEPLVQAALKHYEETKEDIIIYDNFLYSSKRWETPIRIMVKIKINSQGLVKRFFMSNLPGTPEDLFELYNQRGQCENYIKELKNNLNADRLSCHDFRANFFRLLLHCFAYQLVNLFKCSLSKITELADAQIDTLRTRLFKIGATIHQRSRWTWIHLSSSWPWRPTFIKVAHNLGLG